jgi:hypothetical protein
VNIPLDVRENDEHALEFFLHLSSLSRFRGVWTIRVRLMLSSPHACEVISRLVAPLKFTYSSIQVSDVLVLNVRFMLYNSVFQTFPLFTPEMSAWLHRLHCSDYPHLFHLDPVTTAI